jgi:hypothetical protein
MVPGLHSGRIEGKGVDHGPGTSEQRFNGLLRFRQGVSWDLSIPSSSSGARIGRVVEANI